MKPQYETVEHSTPIEYVHDTQEKKNKKKGVFRLVNFSSLRNFPPAENYESQQRKGSYTSLSSSSSSSTHVRDRKWGPFTIPTGWRFAVFGCALTCAVSFLLNLLVTVIAVAKYGVDSSGRLRIYEGDCRTTEKMNTAVHIFINVTSTVLLSSSNYVMQCLCAVTREEVDAAHEGTRRGRWADIGVPSMFNMCLMDRRRVLLWYLLLFSSLPLHLFYNSAVFSSTATFGSPIISVNSKFVSDALDPAVQVKLSSGYSMNFTDYTYTGKTYDTDGTDAYFVDSSSDYNYHEPWLVNGSVEYMLYMVNTLQELSPTQCINAYAQNFQTNMGGLLLVLDVPNAAAGGNNSNVTTPVVFDRMASWGQGGYCDADRYSWICGQTHQNVCYNFYGNAQSCEQQKAALIRTNASAWTPLVDQYAVKQCYAQRAPQSCKLMASIHLISVVLFLNAVKAVLMVLAVKWMRGKPLLTLGDAVASFLEKPDPFTKKACLVGRQDVFREVMWDGQLSNRPRVFDGRRRRWFSGSGKIRQLLISALLLTAVGVIAYLYSWGVAYIGVNGNMTDLASLWRMGIGTVNPATTISFDNMPDSGAAGLVWSAFIANVPQLVLSLIYFTYNGILTAYFLGAEWQSYMRERKGLRVSYGPSGAQRSTYFLQLPYRAALPLMVASGVLHWLVSQSIFLVDIETFVWSASVNYTSGRSAYVPASQSDFTDTKPNILTCGFSPIPMIFVIVIAIVMLLVLLVLGWMPFATSMPVASSNSLAIAAACHVMDGEYEKGDTALKKVKWGAVEEQDKDGIGHCCFSSLYVEEPKKGSLYS